MGGVYAGFAVLLVGVFVFGWGLGIAQPVKSQIAAAIGKAINKFIIATATGGGWVFGILLAVWIAKRAGWL